MNSSIAIFKDLQSFLEHLLKKCLLVADSNLTRIQLQLIIAFSSYLVHTYSNSFVFLSFLSLANT